MFTMKIIYQVNIVYIRLHFYASFDRSENIAETDCFIQSFMYLLKNVSRVDILCEIDRPLFEVTICCLVLLVLKIMLTKGYLTEKN